MVSIDRTDCTVETPHLSTVHLTIEFGSVKKEKKEKKKRSRSFNRFDSYELDFLAKSRLKMFWEAHKQSVLPNIRNNI